MILFIIIFGILVPFIVAFVIRAVYLSRATKGDSIANYDNPKSALLVTDIQNDTLGISKYGNTDPIMKNINSSIKHAKDSEIDIVYTKQAFKGNPLDSLISGGLYQADTFGAELSNEVSVLSENIFNKLRTDAFTSGHFEQHLISNEIDTLYIVGADACACVYKTALGAINRGYRVVVLEDGLFSVKKETLNAMLKRYKSKGIEIMNTNDFIQSAMIYESS